MPRPKGWRSPAINNLDIFVWLGIAWLAISVWIFDDWKAFVASALLMVVLLRVPWARRRDDHFEDSVARERRRCDAIARWHDGPVTKCGYCYREYDARGPVCPHCDNPPDLLPLSVEEWEEDNKLRHDAWLKRSGRKRRMG